MAKAYRGFSTVGRVKKYRITDFELIKQDLVNHLHIRKGEKLMNPNFGTIIWNVLHEPLTEELKKIIIDDVKAVANYDPRLAIDNVIITSYEQGIMIELELRNLRSNQSEAMRLRFDNTQNTVTSA